LKPYHASWLEAFPFTRVSELPAETKTPPAYQGLLSSAETREVFGDGSFGGDYEASPEIMNDLFNAAYQDVLHFLNFE
jgi:creatinine amidohydrolase